MPVVQSHVFDPQLNRWVMTFTADLITIGEKAFSSCSSLTSISFPHTLTKIDDDAFMGCNLLEEVVIPDNVTEIGHYSFQCSNLRKVVLGRSVKKIGIVPYTFDQGLKVESCRTDRPGFLCGGCSRAGHGPSGVGTVCIAICPRILKQ